MRHATSYFQVLKSVLRNYSDAIVEINFLDEDLTFKLWVKKSRAGTNLNISIYEVNSSDAPVLQTNWVHVDQLYNRPKAELCWFIERKKEYD
jgi:hypothetical protein